MLDHLFLAYTSGLIAAVSPCVIVLIPLCLVRFIQQEPIKKRVATNTKANLQHEIINGHQPSTASKDMNGSNGTPTSSPPSLTIQLLQFLLGFQLSYLLFGFFLAEVLTSRIQDGFKFALGTLFLISSILAWKDTDKCSYTRPLKTSPFITGIIFAMLLSFNPCTVPFLALLISFSNPAHTLLSLLCFGQGLITPSLLFVLLGRRLLKSLEATSFKLDKIKPLMYLLLGASGAYLLLTDVYTMSMGDTIVGTGGIILAIVMVHQSARSDVHSLAPAVSFDSDVILVKPVERTPPASKWWSSFLMVLVASLVLCVLFLSVSFFYEHNPFTHTAIDSMYQEAQKKAHSESSSTTITTASNVTVATPSILQSLRSAILGSSPSSSDRGPATIAAATGMTEPSPTPTSSDPTTMNKFQQLKQQLNAINSTPANDLAEVKESDYHHLDQDPLEVPSIMADAEHAHHAPHWNQGISHSTHDQLQRNIHDGIELSQLDLEALVAMSQKEAGGGDDYKSHCIDFSMVPPCFHCSATVWLYRGMVLLLAFITLYYERLNSFLTRQIKTNSCLFIPISFGRVLMRRLSGQTNSNHVGTHDAHMEPQLKC